MDNDDFVIKKWDIYFVSLLNDNNFKNNHIGNYTNNYNTFNNFYNNFNNGFKNNTNDYNNFSNYMNNQTNNYIDNNDSFMDGETIGHEQNMYFRPVIVISNTKYNIESKTPICLCCSSRSKYYYSSKLIENNENDFKTYVNISQVRTLSENRFFKKNFCLNISNNKNIIKEILSKLYSLIYNDDIISNINTDTNTNINNDINSNDINYNCKRSIKT